MIMDNAIPKDWKWVSIGEVAEINPKIPNRDVISDDLEVQFLPMKLVEELSGKIHLIETRPYGEVKKGYTPFINNDVIFAKVTPCMENGKIALVDHLKNEIGFGSSEFHVVRSKENLLSKYAFYYVLQQRFRNDAEHAMTGAVGLRRVPKQFIENYKLPLPSFTQQQQIVSKIEEFFSELDKGIEELKTAQQQLKAYRQAVLKWAFEGKLTNTDVKEGELPKGWKLLSVREVADINPKLPNKELIKDDLEVQFLPMKLVEEIVNKVHLIDTRKFAEVQKRSYTPFVSGDIIFAKVTPCMENGKIAVVDNLKNGIGYGSSEFHVLRCSKNILNTYLFYFLVQDKFRNEAQQAMTGAVGLRRVPKQFIENHLLPLPTTSEQQQIVQEMESRLSVCDKIEETITNTLKQSEALRQSILKKAFEGKLA